MTEARLAKRWRARRHWSYLLPPIAAVCLLAPLSHTPHAAPASSRQGVTEAELWLTPSTVAGPAAELGRAVGDLAVGRAQQVEPVFAKATSDRLLGAYARLYLGRTQLVLKKYDAAMASAREILGTEPRGALGEAALWLMADAAEGAGRREDVIRSLQAITGLTSTTPVTQARALLRLGIAAAASGDTATAYWAFSKVHYELPLTAPAGDASAELSRLTATENTMTREVSRSEALYAARRWDDARSAFARVRQRATGDARDLAELRLAQLDFHQRRYPAARVALEAYADRGTPRQSEAEFALLGTLRGLGHLQQYISQVQAFVRKYGASPLAEAALNELATHYILANEDAKAAEVFSEMFRRYPQGTFADRAAWRSGWWAYKDRNYRETIRVFEAASLGLRRADYRPAWLYWTARSHAALGNRDAASAAYRRVLTDYRNSFYGRQARSRLDVLVGGSAAAAPTTTAPLAVPAGTPPANAPLIRALLGAGLYDDAILELRRLQAETGPSPFLEATIAYALNRKGELRPAITSMRRAYPQFMAEGGERLPPSILRIIFPLNYWELIRRHATTHKLDPYLVAALMAQESTFQAEVRSAANAWGLMQIVPATGRRYASRLGIRPFSTASLTTPEINVRIGTTYLADLIRQFDAVPPALAAYNAGENRVSRWLAERPGVEMDEFIDDIPFPETQNYVKRLVGTAEDYRILYGGAASRP